MNYNKDLLNTMSILYPLKGSWNFNKVFSNVFSCDPSEIDDRSEVVLFRAKSRVETISIITEIAKYQFPYFRGFSELNLDGCSDEQRVVFLRVWMGKVFAKVFSLKQEGENLINSFTPKDIWNAGHLKQMMSDFKEEELLSS